MNGLAAIRLAAVLALGYGLWVLAGGPLHFGAGTGGVALRVGFSHPITWLVGGVALVVGAALWLRQAWAWWLGLAAALFQGWRLAHPFFGANRMPGATTLLALAVLLAFVVLLLLPKARAACNR